MSELIGRTVTEFLAETASSSPAPGGGSVSALAGALSARLPPLVGRLTAGYGQFQRVYGRAAHA